MSKYFISVYNNYLRKIESDKTIEIRYNALRDKMALLDNSYNNYVNSIENASWNELGKSQIINSILPKVKNNNNILINGVLNSMERVISLMKNDLYPMLIELKEKDNEYCEIQNSIKLEELSSSELEYCQAKLKVMDSILINLVKSIDNKIIEIKSYNDLDETTCGAFSPLDKIDVNKAKEELIDLYTKTHKNKNNDSIIEQLKTQIEENKIKKLFDGNLNDERNDLEYITNVDDKDDNLDNGNCIDLSLLNDDWKVINTKLPVSEYASVAYNKGIRQNSNPEKYGDYCLAFSYVHASNMYNGEVDANADCAYKWNHAAEFYDYFNDDKQETLRMVYSQVKVGKPVIMQVNGNSSGTHRHFVTVVGVKSSVNSINDVQESDLLILDSWDGKLESMDTDNSRFMTTGKQTNKNYTGYYLRVLK